MLTSETEGKCACSEIIRLGLESVSATDYMLTTVTSELLTLEKNNMLLKRNLFVTCSMCLTGLQTIG
ncbi:hypothetical protein RND81_07G064100 [Saponaria officinalis]|uniref:Uncharacterized protein n=1 Tax=Saponaria officinalis TaxID=3572 RepID=A0AAW1JNW2_SAPOF